VIDWLLSVLWYSSVVAAALGIAAVIRPIGRLRVATRWRGAALIGLAVAWMALNVVVLPAPTTVFLPELKIDAYAPRYHFREVHTRTIEAPPHRVLAAIKSVTAEDIALFRLFTSIRRLGRPGRESILNAPERTPILDVATRSGFLLLADDGREVLIGSLVAAPRGFRPSRRPDARWFQELDGPGLVKATMNFVVEGEQATRTRLTTETRVFATDRYGLQRFTAYWRTIFPGSWILRVTWLTAIAARAER
jgi:hypothetical protein